MPKPSFTATNKNRDLTYFTDREEILEKFKDFLDLSGTSHHILEVKGNSGTGKTFLIYYLTECICPENWYAGQISFSPSEEPDFQSILKGLESVLKGCVPEQSFQNYFNEKDKFFNKYAVPSNVTINLSAEAKQESKVSHVEQNVHDVKIEVPRVETLQSLRDDLTYTLIEFSKHRQTPLCLFIDGYERLIETNEGVKLIRWLFKEVLPSMEAVASYPLRVVICGWEWPRNVDIEPFLPFHRAELDDFDLTQMKNYLKKRRVIAYKASLSLQEQEKLLNAFYELTKGHPLVLGIAVTYFTSLRKQERNPQSLRANRSVIDEKARIEFLDERLVERLHEPYLTLFQVGPILRSFDHTALQTLMRVKTESVATGSNTLVLNDKTYERFLRYPFIYRKSGPGYEYSFHDLVRRVRLEALRFYSQDKERFHRRMADFYMERAEAEQERKAVSAGPAFKSDHAEWLVEIPKEKFDALLEWFYHTLQVKKLQPDALKVWEALVERALEKGLQQRAGLLMDLLRQLSDEGEPFLSDTSDAYARYSSWYGRYLEQSQPRRVPGNWETSTTSPTLATTFIHERSTIERAPEHLHEAVMRLASTPFGEPSALDPELEKEIRADLEE